MTTMTKATKWRTTNTTTTTAERSATTLKRTQPNNTNISSSNNNNNNIRLMLNPHRRPHRLLIIRVSALISSEYTRYVVFLLLLLDINIFQIKLNTYTRRERERAFYQNIYILSRDKCKQGSQSGIHFFSLCIAVVAFFYLYICICILILDFHSRKEEEFNFGNRLQKCAYKFQIGTCERRI